MPPAVLHLKNRLATADHRYAGGIALLAAIHLAAFGILIWSEAEPVARRIALADILTWGAFNFFWLLLLRRPVTSAALSLAPVVILIVLSQFKHGVVMMTATFVDVMLIDVATVSFLAATIPGLAWKVGVGLVLAVPVLALLWQVEPFRPRRRTAAAGLLLCLAAITGLSLAAPTDREDEFHPHQYVSKFARSGAVAAFDLVTRGVLEADAATADRLHLGNGDAACQAGRKLPHIVMVFDESRGSAR